MAFFLALLDEERSLRVTEARPRWLPPFLSCLGSSDETILRFSVTDAPSSQRDSGPPTSTLCEAEAPVRRQSARLMGVAAAGLPMALPALLLTGLVVESRALADSFLMASFVSLALGMALSDRDWRCWPICATCCGWTTVASSDDVDLTPAWKRGDAEGVTESSD